MNDGRQATGTVPVGDQPLRILILDDNEADRLAVRRGLQQSGIATIIEETASASEALGRIKPQAFDSGDRDRPIQVLSNLLSNALNFSAVGRHVSVRATNDDRAVHISVKDSGAGIPEKDLPRVFDRFWQAGPASKAGAGLGLSICRGIVEAHGGRIWAASKVDRGSTFHFMVPLAES